MTFLSLVIHAAIIERGRIRVRIVGLTFWPPANRGGGSNAFANFRLEWYFRTRQRGPFKVCIGKATTGGNNFDLVLEGSDPLTAKVGLRPWKRDQSGSDLDAAVLWAGIVLGSRELLREFALAMKPGDSEVVWLPYADRFRSNSSDGDLSSFILKLNAARLEVDGTDGVLYDAWAYNSGQIRICCHQWK